MKSGLGSGTSRGHILACRYGGSRRHGHRASSIRIGLLLRLRLLLLLLGLRQRHAHAGALLVVVAATAVGLLAVSVVKVVVVVMVVVVVGVLAAAVLGGVGVALRALRAVDVWGGKVHHGVVAAADPREVGAGAVAVAAVAVAALAMGAVTVAAGKKNTRATLARVSEPPHRLRLHTGTPSAI